MDLPKFQSIYNGIMSLLQYLLNSLQKEKIIPEEIESDAAGKILIEYNSGTGNFTVLSEIDDLSEDSVNILSYLIFHISQGELENFIYESLKMWAGDDPEKKAFNEQLVNQMQKLHSFVLDQKVQSGGRVASPASQVFNFRRMKE